MFWSMLLALITPSSRHAKPTVWVTLVYRLASRNFNPIMATAATVTIAEVEDVVDVGELESDSIVTPSIFVQRVVKGEIDAKEK